MKNWETVFKEDVKNAYIRTGRKPIEYSLKNSVSMWTSVGFHLFKTYDWRYRENDVDLFLDLVESDLFSSFLADTNELIFRNEVVNLLSSREIGQFVKACLECSEPFFFGVGPYSASIGETRSPTQYSRWYDLMFEWRDNPERPLEWSLLIL